MKFRDKLLVSGFILLGIVPLYQNCGKSSGSAFQVSTQSSTSSNPSPTPSPTPTPTPPPILSGGYFSFEMWSGIGQQPFPGAPVVEWACVLSGNFTMDIFDSSGKLILAQFPASFPTAMGKITNAQVNIAPGGYNMAPDGTFTTGWCKDCAYIQIPIVIDNKNTLTNLPVNLDMMCPGG